MCRILKCDSELLYIFYSNLFRIFNLGHLSYWTVLCKSFARYMICKSFIMVFFEVQTFFISRKSNSFLFMDYVFGFKTLSKKSRNSQNCTGNERKWSHTVKTQRSAFGRWNDPRLSSKTLLQPLYMEEWGYLIMVLGRKVDIRESN